MPCDYSKYPADWKAIRARILARAADQCEHCGLRNHATIFRYKADPAKWREPNGCDQGESDPAVYPVTIVLTIAHLDHDETNHAVADDRLAALCQRCHLCYDAPEKARRRQAKAATMPLPLFA